MDKINKMKIIKEDYLLYKRYTGLTFVYLIIAVLYFVLGHIIYSFIEEDLSKESKEYKKAITFRNIYILLGLCYVFGMILYYSMGLIHWNNV